ncbi:hypothetical protein Pcinc_010834 [Petrolisthes cinctipes]|uniref:Uncharacterized protein n=1 Tax=Petrolisthes cinctipes TaxID=88211 RepID=A0AAE1KTA3_PETCI|nr:hypothetical protein Pcinc_010834 [Petrolisthes cinctipes]
MQSHTQEVDYQMEHGLYDQGSPIPSTAKDIAGPSGEGKRKHGGFRNVDLWTTPLTEYFLETVKVHFPDLTGKLQTCSKVWREMHKKMLLVLPASSVTLPPVITHSISTSVPLPSVPGPSVSLPPPFITLEWGPLPPSYSVLRMDGKLVALCPVSTDTSRLRQDVNVVLCQDTSENESTNFLCKTKPVAESSLQELKSSSASIPR